MRGDPPMGERIKGHPRARRSPGEPQQAGWHRGISKPAPGR